MQSDHIVEQEGNVVITCTVGTYNVLHPDYAVRHNVVQGLNRQGRSNWSLRAKAITTYILEAQLDIYLLQEVGKSELSDLKQSLYEHYEMTFFGHPGRRDGTAVLTRRCCLEVVGKQALPLPNANKHDYMCATCVFARDLCSRLLLAIVSAHLDSSCDHESIVVKFLQHCHRKQDCHAIILGGDFNKDYLCSGQGPPGFQYVPGGQGTYRGRQIDWIFFSCEMLGFRGGNSISEKFIASSRKRLSSSGNEASDHTADAVVLSYPVVLLATAGVKGWSGSVCKDCIRLANGEDFHTCCHLCSGGQHTVQCNQRNSCRFGCGRFLNAPYRSCCMLCPGKHTKQCYSRQDKFERTTLVHRHFRAASEQAEEGVKFAKAIKP